MVELKLALEFEPATVEKCFTSICFGVVRSMQQGDSVAVFYKALFMFRQVVQPGLALNSLDST